MYGIAVVDESVSWMGVAHAAAVAAKVNVLAVGVGHTT